MGHAFITTMKGIFLLIVSIGLAVSMPWVVRDDGLDEYLRQILELLKAQMPEGVPHFDIPPIEEDIAKVTIEIDNLVITNLATFETKVAHLDIEQLSLELELTIADLRGDAEYKLDGTLAAIFPLYGEGPMWLEIYGLDAYAKASVLINEEGYIEVTSMDITADFTDIKMHLDNLLGGGPFGESINNLLNVMGVYIWDQVKVLLFPLLDEVLVKVINDALSGCSIADLIENGSCFKDRLEEAKMAGHFLKL